MILVCKEKNMYDFTYGKKYLCLGIRFNEYLQRTDLTIRRDSDGTPSLVEIYKFDMIDSEIPQGWEISFYRHEDGVNTFIEPKEFSGEFWNLYHEGNVEADKLFEEIYRKLCVLNNIEIEAYDS